MHRRTVISLLGLAIVALGAVLYLNVKESTLFRLSAPVANAPGAAVQHAGLPTQVSGTTLTSLTTVSASTLLESPRYTGQDPQNRRWEVTAKSASQRGSAASSTLILNTVAATLEVPAKSGTSSTITLNAEQGSFLKNENQLTLTGNVKVTGYGMTLEAPSITTDLESRQLSATGGVHAIINFKGEQQ